MTSSLNIWGQDVPISVLSKKDLEYLNTLPSSLPTLEWVWKEMDKAWDDLGLDNKRPFRNQPISEYYSHPIWLMNGLFTTLDPVSIHHRESIADFISTLDASTVADYGGGFGELALQIAKRSPDTQISIIEPYPSQLGMKRTEKEHRISYVPALEMNYDVIVAQDVLEHVEDPIGLTYKISSRIRQGGFGIFANNFYPVIKCHLPTNYHLQNSFPRIMKVMGMRFLGNVAGAPHALIFERAGQINIILARLFEFFSMLHFSINMNSRKFISLLK